MPKKGYRITSVHLLITLKKYKGVAMRFMEIYRALKKDGHQHNPTSVSENLRYLVSQGKIVKYEWHNNPRYGIPETREDNSQYIIVKNKGLPDETIELEK